MSQNPFVEKRRAPRIDNNVPVKICSPIGDFVTETKNISCCGTYCRVDKFIEPMTKLQIVLLLPVRKGSKTVTKKISCFGVVVRTQNVLNGDGFDTAIFFNDIQPKDSKALAEFVESVLASKSSVKQ